MGKLYINKHHTDNLPHGTQENDGKPLTFMSGFIDFCFAYQVMCKKKEGWQ